MNWFDKIVAKIGLDKIAHMFGIAYIATIMALVFWKITPDFSSWVYAVWVCFWGICHCLERAFRLLL